MSNEEFEKALSSYADEHITGSVGLVRKIGKHFYDVRQPEIDALKEKQRLFEADNAILRAEIDALAAAPTLPAQSRESLIYDLTAPVPFKTPPTPEVEPVAWHVKRAAFKQYNNGGEFYGRDEAFFNAGFDAGYAHHPANDGLSKAAMAVMKWLDVPIIVDNMDDSRRADVEALRTELPKPK